LIIVYNRVNNLKSQVEDAGAETLTPYDDIFCLVGLTNRLPENKIKVGFAVTTLLLKNTKNVLFLPGIVTISPTVKNHPIGEKKIFLRYDTQNIFRKLPFIN